MKEKLNFLSSWTKFFIDKYKMSILLLIAILVAGFWGASNVQRQDFPAIESNYVFTQARYIGASAEDVEKEILIPIEQIVKSRTDIESVRSTASNSFGSVIIERSTSTGNNEAVSEIKEEIGNITFPSDAEIDVRALDVAGVSMVLGVVNENKNSDINNLFAEAEKIKSRIESSSNNIKKVEILPENEFQIQIKLNAENLNNKQITYSSVSDTIKSYITTLPGGQIQVDNKELAINIKTPIQSLENLKSIKIGSTRLDEIASIERNPSNTEILTFGGYKVDDKTKTDLAVFMLVYKTDNGDIIRLADGVNEEIDSLKSDQILSDGVEVRTLYNLAPSIDQQINSLLENGLLGLLVILVVLLFFINFRTAIVVSLIIPLAFLITLFILPIIGYSLNILTLFAMILTLGILVDNAIVIAEGMAYEMHRGAKKSEAGILAVKHLGPAVTAATVTTIIAFIPFSQMSGIMGDFLKYIPFTIIIMLVVSYFLAISITPLLGKWILKDSDAKDEFAETEQENAKHCTISKVKKLPKWQKALVLPMIVVWGQTLIDKVNMAYCKLMHWLFETKLRKATSIAITLILISISVGYFAPRLKFEQFPSKDGANAIVNFDFPTGTSYEDKKTVYEKVNSKIIELPYFEKFYNFQNAVQIEFTDPAIREDDTTIFEIVDRLNSEIAIIKNDINPEIEIKAENVSYGPPSSSFAIVAEFLSNDSVALENASAELVDFLDEKEEIKKVSNELKEGLVRAVEINFDNQKLSENQIAPLTTSAIINSRFSSSNIGSISVREDGVSDDVVLDFDNDSRNSIDQIKNLLIPTGKTNQLTGIPSLVRLDDISEITEVDKPISISRYKSRRVATVNIELEDDADSAGIQNEIEEYFNEDKLKSLGLEKDSLNFGGQFADFQSDYSNLQIIFMLAVIFVFLVLVYQFNSFSQPLLIMATIPMALIGVFPGLFAVDPSINLISGLGIVALVGIVVNDAIVFVDTMNRLSKENPSNSTADNLVKTGFLRLKPIFSTSITTIAGILPLTILDPFWTGLGVAIISGLIFSTIGTLIVVPVIYHSFSRKK